MCTSVVHIGEFLQTLEGVVCASEDSVANSNPQVPMCTSAVHIGQHLQQLEGVAQKQCNQP
jgi:hypothetical protein